MFFQKALFVKFEEPVLCVLFQYLHFKKGPNSNSMEKNYQILINFEYLASQNVSILRFLTPCLNLAKIKFRGFTNLRIH